MSERKVFDSRCLRCHGGGKILSDNPYRMLVAGDECHCYHMENFPDIAPNSDVDLESSQEKIEALTKEFLSKVMEHAGTAQVFITVDSDNGKYNRAHYQGKGNWYARYGAVSEWVQSQGNGFKEEEDL